MKVMCSDCEQPYYHKFPVKIVCPKCGGADYSLNLDKVEESESAPLIESTVPHLLLD